MLAHSSDRIDFICESGAFAEVFCLMDLIRSHAAHLETPDDVVPTCHLVRFSAQTSPNSPKLAFKTPKYSHQVELSMLKARSDYKSIVDGYTKILVMSVNLFAYFLSSLIF